MFNDPNVLPNVSYVGHNIIILHHSASPVHKKHVYHAVVLGLFVQERARETC